jgi:hypothetical protein
MKTKLARQQKTAVDEFMRYTMATPCKRYPVFVWKVSSIFPSDMSAMFKLWQTASKYKDIKLFESEAEFWNVLCEGFDSFGLNWHMKKAYGREKIYFGNLRLKWYACKLLMKVEGKTYLGK